MQKGKHITTTHRLPVQYTIVALVMRIITVATEVVGLWEKFFTRRKK